MEKAIKTTNFNFPNLSEKYEGKVRDVYHLNNKLVMVVTDRISAFDYVLPRAIPFKGQILNQIAKKFLTMTEDIVPNWIESVPDPNVTIGKNCETFPVEMVIRGYLTGHAWREYKSGKRKLCGIDMPDGMKEHDKFPTPIITPTTKAQVGHDEDISKEKIINNGLVSKSEYEKLEEYTYKIFERGSEYAKSKNLLLVDTKYEFGIFNDELIVIDEIHTPDSSRYWIENEYEKRYKNQEPQLMLDKENIRQWLIDKNFSGEGTPPELSDEIRILLSRKYIELYEKLTGNKFIPSTRDVKDRINLNLSAAGLLC